MRALHLLLLASSFSVGAALQHLTSVRLPPAPRRAQRALSSLAGSPFASSSHDDLVVRPPLGAPSDTSSLTLTFSNPKSTASLIHSDALFGIPAYGGGVGGRLTLPVAAPPLGSGCDPLPAQYPGSVLLLFRAPNCTFTTRVANAQRAGAVGVVVADNTGTCGTGDALCPGEPGDGGRCSACPYYMTRGCQCALPMMSDDGGGAGVRIPSFLISRVDGEALRARLAGGEAVWASLSWDIPTADGAVRYELWQDANDKVGVTFREGFAPLVPLLGAAVEFAPHFMNIDGRAHGCTLLDCATQCVNGGYYCAEDPDGDLFVGVSGADVSGPAARRARARARARHAATPPGAHAHALTPMPPPPPRRL